MPLDDALAGDHSLVVNFLRENMGSGLGGSRYTRDLCYAAASGDAELVMRNLHNGMDCNTSLYDGRTPLHIAASRGHLKVVEFLLSKGAAINAEDVRGSTPLEDAVLNGHELMAHLLRFSGGKLGKKIRVRGCPICLPAVAQSAPLMTPGRGRPVLGTGAIASMLSCTPSICSASIRHAMQAAGGDIRLRCIARQRNGEGARPVRLGVYQCESVEVLMRHASWSEHTQPARIVHSM